MGLKGVVALVTIVTAGSGQTQVTDEDFRQAFRINFTANCERKDNPHSNPALMADLHRLCSCTADKTAPLIGIADSAATINRRIHEAANQCAAEVYPDNEDVR